LPADWVSSVVADWRSAQLSPKQAAMLAYTEKLTLTPTDMQPGDVDALRATGFSDLDVLEICEVACYYAYVNRIAAGLGVALEEQLPED
jgi:uncharacterized peroxidase-related enzyme